jgi:prepilin-type N-terminal cleavage/methylation domain-containing protein
MNKSFTLIEILVVIVVIGILSSFVLVLTRYISQEANIAKARAFSNSVKNTLLLNIAAEWKFEGTTLPGFDAGNGDVLDSWLSNNGDTGTHQPTVVSDSNCASGKCLQFNGTSDYVSVPYSNAFNFGSRLTVFVWVRGNVQTDNKKIVSHFDYGNTNRSWSIGVDDISFNKFEVILSNDGTNGNPHIKQYYTNDVVLDNAWHLLGFTWNGGVGANGGTLKLYIDGKEASVQKARDDDLSGDYTLHNPVGVNLTIGSCLNDGNNNPAYLFSGYIDDIRIYNDIIP